MTFSVVARDAATGDLGCAVQSKFPAVGAIVIHARSGVGAVATQALSNVGYGPRGLALLEAGASPVQAMAELTASDPLADRRQVGIVDAAGRSESHTGGGCSAWAGHIARDGFACHSGHLTGQSPPPARFDLQKRLRRTLMGLFRGRGDLVMENLLQRHQLQVALRSRPRPHLKTRDRLFWLVVRLHSGWRQHLILVRPETVVR